MTNISCFQAQVRAENDRYRAHLSKLRATPWYRKLASELHSLLTNRQTRKNVLYDKLGRLLRAYEREETQNFSSKAKRKLLSADTLHIFPKVAMLTDEARYAILVGDYATAHAKLDEGSNILADASHRVMMDHMRNHAQNRGQQQEKRGSQKPR